MPVPNEHEAPWAWRMKPQVPVALHMRSEPPPGMAVKQHSPDVPQTLPGAKHPSQVWVTGLHILSLQSDAAAHGAPGAPGGTGPTSGAASVAPRPPSRV